MKRNKERLITGIALTVIAAFVVIWLLPAGLSPAPPLLAKTLDGRTLTLEQFRGKPVLITFWATTCPSCIQEIPHLIELYQEFKARGLEIIGVAMSYDPEQQVRALVEKRQIPYPIVLDTTGSIARTFNNVQLTPTTLLISPEGGIMEYRLGMLDLAKLRATLNAL